MKPMRSNAFATWLLEKLIPGYRGHALSGDLLEEFHRGRPAAWYWYQVTIALAIELREAVSEAMFPLVYSAAWSAAFSVWTAVARNQIFYSRLPISNVFWPWSAILQVTCSIVPVLVYVWLGALVYIATYFSVTRAFSVGQIVMALSASLNVLLLFSIEALSHFRHPEMDLQSMGRSDFFSVFHLFNLNIPVWLSLLTALLLANFQMPRISRRRRFGVPNLRKVHGAAETAGVIRVDQTEL
jgi:hypothetical protein